MFGAYLPLGRSPAACFAMVSSGYMLILCRGGCHRAGHEENETRENQDVTTLVIKIKTSGMSHDFPTSESTTVRADYSSRKGIQKVKIACLSLML